MVSPIAEPGALSTFVQTWHAYRPTLIIAIAAAVIVYQVYRANLSKEPRSNGSATPAATNGASEKENTEEVPVSQVQIIVSEYVEDQGAAIRNTRHVKAKTGPKSAPKRVTGNKVLMNRKTKKGLVSQEKEEGDFDIQIIIFYSSLTGSTAEQAQKLKDELFSTNEGIYPKLSIPTPSNALGDMPIARNFLPAQLLDLEAIELDDYFTSVPASPEGQKIKYIYLIVTPSYETDSPLAFFLDHLEDVHHDFRVDTAPLSSLAGFAVFGFGDSSEWPMIEGTFCKDAVQADKWMGKLTGGRGGSRRMFPLGMGDCNPASTPADSRLKAGDANEKFQEWRLHLEDAMREYAEIGTLGGGPQLRSAVESADEASDDEEAEDETEEPMDLEDLGKLIKRSPDALGTDKKEESRNVRAAPLPIDFTTPAGQKALAAGEGQSESRKEMVPVDGTTYKALTKQGYTIVGSHSGVKICRWTKSALRGRGSCYKFSFYGIKSHLCMETTPSLSCSNKCVFCWRHGTNPVGTTWRWKVDQPDEIFKGVVEGHYRKIKMMKGVPGVRADRFSEAFRIRHCALSLVGEPIFYPYINEFLALLHKSRISSFLVCNAQHPKQLETLGPVTQLYVSIDASNKESLKRIDRPLHRDFWERFQSCLDTLRVKRATHRTVFRLTLVKGFNIDDEVSGYADLIEHALPHFIEIKGVTYCGTSTSSDAGLTMGNVPWYTEVVAFVEALDKELSTRGLEYGIAAEHAHSCCALLASNNYKINGKWHTRIDYEKFFELLESGMPFKPEDYVGEETPEWATWGNGGFDPADTRVYRNGKGPKKVEIPAGGACGTGEDLGAACGTGEDSGAACGTGEEEEEEGGGCG